MLYTAASEPKEMIIVPNADHVDLYDKVNIIPFDKLESFFKANLNDEDTAKAGVNDAVNDTARQFLGGLRTEPRARRVE